MKISSPYNACEGWVIAMQCNLNAMVRVRQFLVLARCKMVCLNTKFWCKGDEERVSEGVTKLLVLAKSKIISASTEYWW